MKTPRLNRRLTLESPARVSDGAGGFAESWSPLGVLWAELTARTGRETVATGAAVSAVPYAIVVRGAPVGHPERPMAKQRFRDGNRLFHIRSVAERDPEGRYLICMADEEIAI
ncbi:phage head closure protein [Tateyamaria sp. ANG-S1]|uniref:phage head closure protein n=1 Tax=Tateyamaria sp. ANG-S1 TaxID=1577905 RepID=UPI00057CDEBF|nr:phage head closure protein [Tateyamaria sp. ANG-S1]KIC49107.1 tail protein [Tateyamaria sp. ANG-S1]